MEMEWTPVIYTPVNLTIRFGAGALDVADPGPWCQQAAAELLGAGADRRQVARLARCLKKDAAHFRRGKEEEEGLLPIRVLWRAWGFPPRRQLARRRTIGAG